MSPTCHTLANSAQPAFPSTPKSSNKEPRLNAHLKEMLTTFKQMFGEGFLRHMMICFTRWEYDKRAKKKRARSGNSEESRASLMNAELRKLLGHDFDCPCVFLDNVMNACSTEELSDLYDDELEDIQQQFDAELEKVRAFVFAARLLAACIGERRAR